MSDSRKILINESFLSSSSMSKKNKGGGKSKTKKNKPKSIIKPNSLKKTLLEKIKKHQQHEKMTADNSIHDKHSDKTNDSTEFHDNFMNSLEYLNKLNEKNNDKKKQTKRNKSLKKTAFGGSSNKTVPTIHTPQEPLISVNLPMDFDNPNNNSSINPHIHTTTLNENSLYGGNNINSFSQPVPIVQQRNPIVQQRNPIVQQRNTIVQQPIPIVQQRNPIVQQSIPIVQQPVINKTDTPYGCLKGGKKPTYRVYHNKTLKNKPITIKSPNNNPQHNERKQKLAALKKSYKKIRQKKRTTRKSTFTLGKIGEKVSVLIKNNATRRKVKREHGLLKQKSISEIKKHLYDKNLLKIGSTAPNDVLRTLYEQSILAGDVTNIANDVQIHNFMNK
jgi:hypothetical protein